MCEGGGRGGGGRRARILLHLHIQLEGTVLRGSRAGWRSGCRNHPSCVHVRGRRTRGGGRRSPWDLKMQLETGRADERVSRGQASERAVCVCEAVSVEMGARRPPLPTGVVCPQGRRRRLRLAITARACLLGRATGPCRFAGRSNPRARVLRNALREACDGYHNHPRREVHGQCA